MKYFFFILAGSLSMWVSAQVTNIPITEVPSTVKRNALVIDVRTPEEFAEGHLPGALNLNWFDPDFAAKVSDFRKGKKLLIYCRSGKRSAKASAVLDSLGFKKVYNLTGGYNAWKGD